MIHRRDLTLSADIEDLFDGEEPAPFSGRARSAEEVIDAWLTVLGRLLQLPEDESQSICAELREHMGERIRDLIIAGTEESAAVRQSIRELGDTAELAQRFRKVNKDSKHRRRRMHFTMIGVGAVVVATGVVLVKSPGHTQLAVPYETESVQAETPADIQTQRITINAKMTLGEVMEEIDKRIELKVVPRWFELEDYDITPEIEISVDMREVKIIEVLKIIPQVLVDCEVTAWRYYPEHVEFGLQETFDRREVKLVSYTIDHILLANATLKDQTIEEAADELRTLLHSLVSSEDWQENGGSLAHLQIVGGKMFIEAPQRMHKRILWILNQFDRDEPGDSEMMVNEWGLPIEMRDDELLGGTADPGVGGGVR